MDIKNEVWNLMAKFMANEASDEERAMMNKLFVENSNMEAIFRKLNMFYLTSEISTNTDSSQAFKRLDERIKNATQ
jgi:hypothetical protein